MTPEQEAYIRYQLDEALETLEEAKVMLETGHLRGAVNRLYYACFYCVSALLLCDGLSSSKHSGIRSLFFRHWVKSARVSKEPFMSV
ncbi:MAG: HEPN domain-containing protein [Planctomycetes bacterium]|nr:HEPN domain-containing protein [Planctomycetota bacterium]MBM4083581.1 HEPN domain-containing protein [Planctomycetota bacterium]